MWIVLNDEFLFQIQMKFEISAVLLSLFKKISDFFGCVVQ